MDKLIPISIVIGIVILGLFTKFMELKYIIKRTNFTISYHNKLFELINGISRGNGFSKQIYYELTLDVNSMQYELGNDGIVDAIDNLKGISVSNYPFLINFLPELRNMVNGQDSNIMMMYRFDQQARDCDDMFVRHLGSLKEEEKAIKKNLLNPFSCFSAGIKFFISLPVLLLNWLGLISDERTQKAKHSWLIRLLNFVAIVVGFIGSVVTITIGWSDFWNIIYNAF